MLLNLAIIVLGVNLLAKFIREKEAPGPLGILDRFRYIIGIRYNVHSELYGLNPVAQGLTCKVCGPIWIGLVVTPFFYYWSGWTALAFLPLAIGNLSYLIDTLLND